MNDFVHSIKDYIVGKKFVQSWQWYRDFFSLSYIKYMVTWFAIVPFIALLFSKVPDRVAIPSANTAIEFTLDLPFTWQFLWTSSVMFVFAFILYQWKCPTFVKRYHSFDDYKKMGHSPRWIPWESKQLIEHNFEREKFIERLESKNYLEETTQEFTKPTVLVKKNVTELAFSEKDKNYIMAMPIISNQKEDNALTEIAVREIFWEIFGRYASSHAIIRLIVASLLYLSLTLVIVVVIQNILAGLRLVIGL